MQQGGSLNRTGKNGAQNGPLRKIVRTGTLPDCKTPIPVEVLECGHHILPAEDMMGKRYPKRRRCNKCKESKPPDYPQTP